MAEMGSGTDLAVGTTTAIIVRSALPAWVRWGWASLVTLASLGGWVVDHCTDEGTLGAVLRGLWSVRHPAPMSAPAPAPAGPPVPPAGPGPRGPGPGLLVVPADDTAGSDGVDGSL